MRIASLVAPNLLPYVAGAVGAVILALIGALAFHRLVTIPLLESERDSARSALKAEVAVSDGLRRALAVQNAEIERIAANCKRRAAAADRAGIEAAKPKPFVNADTAEELNEWLLGVGK